MTVPREGGRVLVPGLRARAYRVSASGRAIFGLASLNGQPLRSVILTAAC